MDGLQDPKLCQAGAPPIQRYPKAFRWTTNTMQHTLPITSLHFMWLNDAKWLPVSECVRCKFYFLLGMNSLASRFCPYLS